MIKGQYEILQPDGSWLVLPNLLTDEGVEAILEKLFRDGGGTILGTDLYIGLLDEVVTKTMVMADITTEPSAAGGYARQPISRTGVTWTIGQIGTEGYRYALSDNVTFTAAGGNYSRAFTRLFLASALTGGTLISVSSPLSFPFQILDTESHTMRYRFFLA